MRLNLTRPIVFFDLETTGTNVNSDRIVEISVIKLLPDGRAIEKTRRINPEMPIPAEATAVHHITDEDVAGEKTFRQVAASLAQLLTGCDIAVSQATASTYLCSTRNFAARALSSTSRRLASLTFRQSITKRSHALFRQPISTTAASLLRALTARVLTLALPWRCFLRR